MKTIEWLAGAALLLGAHAALAQEPVQRFYLGAGAGMSEIDKGIADGLVTSGSVDGSDSGSKIFGGYRFHRNWALEFAWIDLGKLSYAGDFLGTPVTGGTVKVSGLNSSLVALYPAHQSVELFAKAGLYAWDAKASDVTGGVPFSAKDDGVNLSLGLGANWYFHKILGARLEWEYLELDPKSASLLSASVIARF